MAHAEYPQSVCISNTWKEWEERRGLPEDKDQKRPDDRETGRSIQAYGFDSPSRRFC
jgi:hypothetical protein